MALFDPARGTRRSLSCRCLREVEVDKMSRMSKAAMIIGGLFALLFLFGCAHPSPYTPFACIEADPTIGYAPLTVSFDASCSFAEGMRPPPPGMFNYLWDFGDGTAGSGMTVEHTFDEPGTFKVQLMLTHTEGRMAGIPVERGSFRIITVLPVQPAE